jgi:hypothetical protein
MWKEKLKLLVQVDRISNEEAMNNYWNDSEWYFVRPKSDGSYNTDTMIIINTKSYG